MSGTLCSSEASDKTPILIQKLHCSVKRKKLWIEDKKNERKEAEKVTFYSHRAYSLCYSGTAALH